MTLITGGLETFIISWGCRPPWQCMYLDVLLCFGSRLECLLAMRFLALLAGEGPERRQTDDEALCRWAVGIHW